MNGEVPPVDDFWAPFDRAQRAGSRMKGRWDDVWDGFDKRLPEVQLTGDLVPNGPFAFEADGLPPAMSATAFLAAARPPRFLIDPIIQRGFLYTVTARSFHGKTTLMIYLCICIAMGRQFAGLHTEQGRIAYFVGENPDEFAQKLAVACAFWDVDPDQLPITFIPGAFDLATNLDAMMKKAGALGPLAGVIVDTSAAYRFDEDEDDNQGSKEWAQTLRHLTRLPGDPAVLTPCHPIKNAERLNLLPRGGGAFLNEVDGNLTLWADLDARTTELHWSGKLRGPSFKPISFDLRSRPHPTAQHRDGRPIELAVAVPGEATGPGRKAAPGKVSAAVALFHAALLDAMSLPLVPDERPTPGETTATLWQAECVRRGLVEPGEAGETGKERSARFNKFRDAKRDLLVAQWIGCDGNRVMNLKK